MVTLHQMRKGKKFQTIQRIHNILVLQNKEFLSLYVSLLLIVATVRPITAQHAQPSLLLHVVRGEHAKLSRTFDTPLHPTIVYHSDVNDLIACRGRNGEREERGEVRKGQGDGRERGVRKGQGEGGMGRGRNGER